MLKRSARGHRVVVTGLGLATPVGNDVESAWNALLAGRSGAGPITHFDATEFEVRFAAEVKDFDPSAWMDRKEVRRTDRFTQFAMAVAQQAVEHSQLESYGGLNRDRVGVIIASGIGGIATFEEQARVMVERLAVSAPASAG